MSKKRLLNNLRDTPTVFSPLSDHLNFLKSTGDDGAESAEILKNDIVETFTSENGLRVLKLLEKSVLLTSLPTNCSDSALREMNGARNLVNDIRRIVAYG